MAAGRVVRTVLVVLLAGLTSCGNDDRDDGPTPAALAQRSGCTQLTTSETDEVGVLERGRCFLGSQPVVFSTFSNNEIRDLWLEGASDLGALVVGDRFVGHSGSRETAALLADSLEGVTVHVR